MSRYDSYLNSAVTILSIYNGDEPLSSFLKKYFAEHKKHGSKDRKQITHLCYCFFRLGKSLSIISAKEKIILGLFLCSNMQNEILAALKPEWNEKAELPIEEKLAIANYPSLIPGIFPWESELSEGMEHDKFFKSVLTQPDLFLRLRPGKESSVIGKLQKAGMDFKKISDSCLALDNATKVDSIIEIDEEAVIQDYSSQQTGNFIKSEILILKSKIRAWDCCAGSGGKSIMLYDINPQIQLTVSDKRESILINLKKRFEIAGIKNYKSFVADLTHGSQLMIHGFDLILADVPCTGSGTWSRTPEQLYYFDPKKIDEYSAIQKKIISNVIPTLKKGGYFAYITCSVFKKENEEAVTFIKDQFKLELIKLKLLKGYEQKADSMFIAVFQNPL